MNSLFDRCANARHLKPARTAVVYPLSQASLGAAYEAADAGYIEPALVGPHAR